MLSLSNILKINAISSGATGLLLALFPSTAAQIFATAYTAPFISVGIFLVLFALYVFKTSIANTINSKAVKTIVALDTSWVAGSVVALLFLGSTISLVGSALIAGVAVWVALMAYLQNKALKQSYINNRHAALV